MEPFSDTSSFTDKEKGALRRIAQERIAAETDDMPFNHDYEAEVERLRAQGIEVKHSRFCWLRGRRHNFKGKFLVGSPSWGYERTFCVDCGHSFRSGAFGKAIWDQFQYPS